MLKTCKEYAEEHGLKFSTDPNTRKSETRYLAFLQRDRVINLMVLCGNELPWIKSCNHLGITIVSVGGGDIRSQDVRNKRAAFINRNNDILQEFHFAHPMTTAEVNMDLFFETCRPRRL